MFICPVLERPHLLNELLNSWELCSHYPLHVMIAHDDDCLEGYLDIINSCDLPTLSFSIYPFKARGTASVLNYFYRMCPHLGYYGFIGEDCVLTTTNFPLPVLANYWAVSWPNEHFHGSELCTHFVVGGELVRAVGHFANPMLFHSFIDNSWHTIGKNLGVLHYCPVVVYFHNHPLVSGREADHVNTIAQEHYRLDELNYHTWAKYELHKLLSRINP